MPRERYILVPGEGLVPAHEFFARQEPRPRGPSIISDMQETQSMVDGQVYSSKKHYRDSLRAHGVREVGNDWNNQPMKHDTPKIDPVAPDIAESIKELS